MSCAPANGSLRREKELNSSAMHEAARDYIDCPAGSVGAFSTFGFLTFLLILLNVILNLSESASPKSVALF